MTSFCDDPNSYQVDGEHYKSAKYQHWDFVKDAKLDYLMGCVTKYIFRHQHKNGVSDLKKAKHYLAKIETSIKSDRRTHARAANTLIYWVEFTNDFDRAEQKIMRALFSELYFRAQQLLSELISEIEHD